MDQHWYIYRKDHHLGPFSAANLRELYLRGSLASFEQIWRQGDEGWLALKDYRGVENVFALKDDSEFVLAYKRWNRGEDPFPRTNKQTQTVEMDGPPDLPPLPAVEEQSVEQHSELFSDSPPDLPPLPVEDEPSLEVESELEHSISPVSSDELQREDLSEVDQYAMEADEELLAPEEELEEEQEDDLTGQFEVASLKRRRRWPWVVALLTPFILIGLSIFAIYQLEKDRGLKHLGFVAPAFVQKDIWNTIRASKVSSIMKIVMDNSGKQMWLISNFPYQAKVDLKFSSIDRKILSEEAILFRTQIEMEKHIGKIKKVVYEKGSKIIPGSYRVTIKGQRTGWLASLLSHIYRPSIAKYLNLIYDPHLKFYTTTTAFVAHGTPALFDKKLKAFFHRKKMERLAPFKEWGQKFATLSAALTKFKSLIHNHIARYKHYRDREYFERDYSSLVGGLIQNLIVSEQKSDQRLSPDNPLFAYQKKFVSYAIESSRIGGEAAAALEKKKRRFHKKWKNAFTTYFTDKIDSIQMKVDKASTQIKELYLKL